MKKIIYISLFIPFFINSAAIDVKSAEKLCSEKTQEKLVDFLEMACFKSNTILLNNIITFFEKLEKAKRFNHIPLKFNSAGYLSVFLEDKVELFDIIFKYAKYKDRLFISNNIICPMIESILKARLLGKEPNQICDSIIRSFWQNSSDRVWSDFIHIVYVFCYPNILKIMTQYYSNMMAYSGEHFIVDQPFIQILLNEPREDIICYKYEKLTFLLETYFHNFIYNENFIKSIVYIPSMMQYVDYLFTNSYEHISENLATILLLVVVTGNYDQKYFDHFMTRAANFYHPAFENCQENLKHYLSVRESALDISI